MLGVEVEILVVLISADVVDGGIDFLRGRREEKHARHVTAIGRE